MIINIPLIPNLICKAITQRSESSSLLKLDIIQGF